MSDENNFKPNLEGYKPLRPFNLFMKNNFPFIENTFEALDTYGLLCEIVKYLNTVIDNTNTMENNVTALSNAFNQLNDYVSRYFDNLDVQEEINNKLDEMVEDGTFQELLSEYLILDTITVKVPTDFETIEDALEYYYPRLIGTNKEVVILIEENHKLTRGVKLINGDYSHFRITSENSYQVQLDENFVGYNAQDTYEKMDGIANTLFVGINCTFPTIDCIFDMENNFGDGIALYLSTGLILEGAGIINSGRYGIYAKDSSKVYAEGTIWSGSNSAGIRLQHTTCGTFKGSTLIGCCKTDTELASVYVSKQCICQVRESTIEDNPHSYGLLARRSRVDIEATYISNCQGAIKAESGSFISATNVEVDNMPNGYAIYSVNSIIVGSKVSNCPHSNFYVAAGGIILNAQKSTSLEDGVAFADCRGISAFNVMNENGMITTKDTNPAYQLRNYVVNNTTIGKILTFPDHIELLLHYDKTISALAQETSTTIDLTTDLTIPDGYSIHSYTLNIAGRNGSTGGGATTLLNVGIGRSLSSIFIYNTGITSSSGTETVNSLNINGRIILTKT